MRSVAVISAAFAAAALPAAVVAQSRPVTTSAVCVLKPTTLNVDQALAGKIDITTDATTGKLSFAYSVTGLSDGAHGIHVHTLGDVTSTDASATGGHYVGTCDNCRPGAGEQTVGYIGDGATITSAANSATGTIEDSVAKLHGVNSILGRSIVIHGNAASSGARVAQCVIGALGTGEPDTTIPAPTTQLPDTPVSASCVMSGASINGAPAVTGTVHFHEHPGTGAVEVKWDFAGLSGNSWTFHVHQAGDISSTDAKATLGHFKGVCENCRPGATNQEIGNLNDGNAWTTASGSYTDTLVKFAGVNSIIGRSVVIHGTDTDPSTRVAQCVIGIEDEIPLPPTPNVPQFATCNLKPTPNNANQGLTGTIEFHPTVDGNMHIHYDVDGLSDGNHGWHVHTLGDVSAADATATGGHFKGDCASCRPAGASEQTAGLIADGTPIVATNGKAVGDTIDKVIKLSGANGVVGRSIVIHGNAADAGARVAQCVIGVNEKAEPTPAAAPADDGHAVLGTKVTKATCSFASATAGGNPITGKATFTVTAPASNCGAYELSMTMDVDGLAPGSHTAHIHQSGNVGSTGATETLGHFVGVCNNCRAAGAPAEVGAFNDGAAFTADAQGKATLSLVDKSMSLSGLNSILGRSIVIHGDGTNAGARVAQCAIGISEENSLADLAPCGGAPVVVHSPRKKAVCTFESTLANGDNKPVTGQMSFVRADDGSYTDVSYTINGLADGTHTYHVHTLGDLSDPIGAMATGGHFKGDCDSCRPATAIEQTVGLLGDGTHVMSSTAGTATGSFRDTVIRFAGTNSIIGRSIVVHGDGVNSGARVAQCVVGLDETDEPGSELTTGLFETQEARCELRAVRGSAASWSDDTLMPSGSVIFEMDRDTRTTRVTYTMRNLPTGESTWHIHQAGNLLDAKSTLGHFIGDCDKDSCRPEGVAQEVGMIGNGAKVYVSEFGAASGDFHDAVLQLNGPKSIVGRSVVVHAPDGSRVMSCVIGRTMEGTRAPSRPEPTAAKCFLRATRHFTGAAANNGYEDLALGYIDIRERAETGDLEYKYYIEGLSEGTHQFHVHDWGNVLAEDASATGGHFIGRCGGSCRPKGVKQEVGMLQDGKNLTVSDAITQGTFVDSITKLSGPNSIIGRSIVVHGNTTSSGARVAMCVIGVAETNEPSSIPYYAVEEPPMVSEAICHFRPFRPNAPAEQTKQVTGTVRIRGGASGITMDYYIAQLPVGAHSWHVHQAGDISDPAAKATLGHFVGVCPDCRSGTLDEAGLIGDGAPILAGKDGIALGRISDGVASLNGVNSIIGRSIVIHGDGTEAGKGVRIAQCVIGINRETRARADVAAAAAQEERNSLEAQFAAQLAEASEGSSSSKATIAGLAIATGVCAIGAVGAIAFAATKKGVPAGTNRV